MAYKTVMHQDGTLEKIDLNKSVSSTETISFSELDNLQANELRVLCRRLLCENGSAAMMTEEETAQAMLDTLANTALRPIVPGINIKADIQSRLAAIDKWLDRAKGKPAQSLNMNVKDNRMDRMEIDKLIRLAGMLDEPIIIPPMPEKDAY